MDRRWIWAQMKKLCDGAGVLASKVFPHSLRHLFARCYYEKEKDLVRLADYLGHSSLETTRRYYDKQILMTSCPGGYTVLLKYPPEQLSIINASIH